jgi:copper(I)-binding protein
VNRALRAATMGALLLSPIALSACGAGQVNQTTSQTRDRVGAGADADTVSLRAVVLEYPTSGRYDAGDDAELQAAIVNTGDETDRLVSIESEAFEEVRVLGSDASAPSGGVDIEIPRKETVFLGADGPTVLLENLAEDLTTGQSIELTMTFEQAGDVTVRALVDTPERDLDRGEPFDFHHEEEPVTEAGAE